MSVKRQILPMQDPGSMEVIHCRHHLSNVPPRLRLRQPPPRANSPHDVTAAAELRDQVVRVLGLHQFEELDDMAVADLGQQAALAAEVLADVGVLLGGLLVYHLDGHLDRGSIVAVQIECMTMISHYDIPLRYPTSHDVCYL